MVENMKINNLILCAFFTSNAFFNWPSVLLSFFMSLASNVASVLLITGSHHYTFYILYLVHFVQREIILDFTAKITHSEKAIHFLSLMSCSINTLKSYMFFTCKNFMFSDFMRKKMLLQEMVRYGACSRTKDCIQNTSFTKN